MSIMLKFFLSQIVWKLSVLLNYLYGRTRLNDYLTKKLGDGYRNQFFYEKREEKSTNTNFQKGISLFLLTTLHTKKKTLLFKH